MERCGVSYRLYVLKILLYCVVSVQIINRYDIGIKRLDIDMDAAYRYIA